MAEETVKNEEQAKEEEMINPSDIIFEEESDADMPVPETENYDKAKTNELDTKFLRPTVKFMRLFEDCLGKMPYASVLKNNNGDSIKLVDLVKFVEAKQNRMTVNEMNTIIGFVATCPLENVRPLMEIIEDSKRQPELWTLE